MFSVRLVSADSYQAQPLPQLDPTFSEFRGSEIKHVPVIRIFGTTATGEKTCLHVHGVFPYLFVPYTGEEDPTSLAYRLAASLDAAINVSLGSATSNTQHVYLIHRVSGIPFYGYHRKEHQYLKIYFYNPAITKRAADLLQNGSVLNRSLQPHEAHIPYLLQFMIDYNVYGMSLVKLSGVKHRRLTQSLAEIASSGQSATSDSSDVEYLPATVERQSTCELEIDALASDITNRREIENGLELNPGLAAIWEEERARRALAGLQGGDSQLVNPKSPPRPTFRPTDNDIYQEQRLGRRLLTISQCDESSLSTTTNQSVAYAAEIQEGEHLLNSSHLPFSRPSGEKSQLLGRDDPTLRAIVDDSTGESASQRMTPDCSILGADDVPLIDLLVQLAGDGAESKDSVDLDSLLGSQVSLLNAEKSDNEDDEDEDDVVDLNLTSLQLDSLEIPATETARSQENRCNIDLSPFVPSCGTSSSSRSANDEKPQEIDSYRLPQYDGAGDVSPTLLNSDDESNGHEAKEFSHLPEYNKNCEPPSKRFENLEETLKIPLSSSFPTCRDGEKSGDRCRSPTAAGFASSPPLATDAYMTHYNSSHGYEPLDLGPEFVPDLEGLHSSMEIGILLSSADSDSPDSVDGTLEDEAIPLETVLNGDPCFTESAELDKSDLTELQDQYVSLLGNSLLPDVHANPRIDSDLGNSSNFSDSDYQTSEKTCEILLSARSPRSSLTSRESSSSSENVAPNVQDPEARKRCGINACKDSLRVSADNSDYNCNVVATWAELQNLQFVEKEKTDGARLGRSKERGQLSQGSLRSRRRPGRRSDERAASQILRLDFEAISGSPTTLATLQVVNSGSPLPRKISAGCEAKSPAKITTLPPIGAEITIVESKCTEFLVGCGELVASVAGGSPELPRVPHVAAEVEIEQQPSFDDSEVVGRLEAAEESIEKIPEACGDVENHSPRDCGVDEAKIAAAEAASEDRVAEIEEAVKTAEIPEGFSWYSSEKSHKAGCERHRHCTRSQDGRIIQKKVFTSEQLWVIEKRKRGRQSKRGRHRICGRSGCGVPVVALRKIVAKSDEDGVDAKNSRTNEVAADSPEEKPAESQKIEAEKSTSASPPIEETNSPKKRERVKKSRASRISSLSSDSSSSGEDDEPVEAAEDRRGREEKPRDPESSDWAEADGEDFVKRFNESRELMQNTRRMRRRYSRKKRSMVRNSKKLICSRVARATRKITNDGVSGVVGAYRSSRNRSRPRNAAFACCNGDETPRRKLEPVLFANWETRPNGLVNSAQSGFPVVKKAAGSPKGPSMTPPPFDFPVSPIPKSQNHSQVAKSTDSSQLMNRSSTPKKMSSEVGDETSTECATLAAMMRDVKCPNTRAKLSFLLQTRRKTKTSDLGETETEISAKQEDDEDLSVCEAKAEIPEVPEVPAAIPVIVEVAKNSREPEKFGKSDDEDLSTISEPPSFESVTEVGASTPGGCEPTANSETSYKFLNSTVSDDPGGKNEIETYEDEFEILEIEIPEENPGKEGKKASRKSDELPSTIAEGNFFSGNDYSIDAVSIEMPACLFEEDSNSVEKRSPRKLADCEKNSRNVRGNSSDISVDPRDLDVYDVESLTPSSSLAVLSEATSDAAETTLNTSGTVESSIHESLTTSEAPSGEKSHEIYESSFEEASPEFEALSPRSEIRDSGKILGDDLATFSSTGGEKVNENSQLDPEIQDLMSRIVAQIEANVSGAIETSIGDAGCENVEEGEVEAENLESGEKSGGDESILLTTIKSIGVDENFTDADSERRSLKGEKPVDGFKDEVTKKPPNFSPVSIKLVNIDLSRFDGFKPRNLMSFVKNAEEEQRRESLVKGDALDWSVCKLFEENVEIPATEFKWREEETVNDKETKSGEKIESIECATLEKIPTEPIAPIEKIPNESIAPIDKIPTEPIAPIETSEPIIPVKPTTPEEIIETPEKAVTMESKQSPLNSPAGNSRRGTRRKRRRGAGKMLRRPRLPERRSVRICAEKTKHEISQPTEAGSQLSTEESSEIVENYSEALESCQQEKTEDLPSQEITIPECESGGVPEELSSPKVVETESAAAEENSSDLAKEIRENSTEEKSHEIFCESVLTTQKIADENTAPVGRRKRSRAGKSSEGTSRETSPEMNASAEENSSGDENTKPKILQRLQANEKNRKTVRFVKNRRSPPLQIKPAEQILESKSSRQETPADKTDQENICLIHRRRSSQKSNAEAKDSGGNNAKAFEKNSEPKEETSAVESKPLEAEENSPRADSANLESSEELEKKIAKEIRVENDSLVPDNLESCDKKIFSESASTLEKNLQDITEKISDESEVLPEKMVDEKSRIPSNSRRKGRFEKIPKPTGRALALRKSIRNIENTNSRGFDSSREKIIATKNLERLARAKRRSRKISSSSKEENSNAENISKHPEESSIIQKKIREEGEEKSRNLTSEKSAEDVKEKNPQQDLSTQEVTSESDQPDGGVKTKKKAGWGLELYRLELKLGRRRKIKRGRRRKRAKPGSKSGRPQKSVESGLKRGRDRSPTIPRDHPKESPESSVVKSATEAESAVENFASCAEKTSAIPEDPKLSQEDSEKIVEPQIRVTTSKRGRPKFPKSHTKESSAKTASLPEENDDPKISEAPKLPAKTTEENGQPKNSASIETPKSPEPTSTAQKKNRDDCSIKSDDEKEEDIQNSVLYRRLTEANFKSGKNYSDRNPESEENKNPESDNPAGLKKENSDLTASVVSKSSEKPPAATRKKGRSKKSAVSNLPKPESLEENFPAPAEESASKTESLAREEAETRPPVTFKRRRRSEENAATSSQNSSSENDKPNATDPQESKILMPKTTEEDTTRRRSQGRSAKMTRSQKSSSEKNDQDVAEKIPVDTEKSSLGKIPQVDARRKSRQRKISRPTSEDPFQESAFPAEKIVENSSAKIEGNSEEVKTVPEKLQRTKRRGRCVKNTEDPEETAKSTAEETDSVVAPKIPENLTESRTRSKKRGRPEKSPAAQSVDPALSAELPQISEEKSTETLPGSILLPPKKRDDSSLEKSPVRAQKRACIDSELTHQCSRRLRSLDSPSEKKTSSNPPPKKNCRRSTRNLNPSPSKTSNRIQEKNNSYMFRSLSKPAEDENRQEEKDEDFAEKKGANGLAEQPESTLSSVDNVSLDLSSLQEASRQLRQEKTRGTPGGKKKSRGQERRIPSREPEIKSRVKRNQLTSNSNQEPVDPTIHQPSLDQRVVQSQRPRQPKIILKRLSRDTLKTYGLEFQGRLKKFVNILKKPRDDSDYQVPAYDGPADFSSSESEDDQAAADVTVAREEKRVCVYRSGKKPAEAKREAIFTPVKRRLEDSEPSSASKHRALDSPGTAVKTPRRSPSRTSTLTRSPGRVSGFYPPLQIIVTSPKVRRDNSEAPDETLRDNRDRRLHENLLRGRIAATNSPRRDLGDKRRPDTTGSQRPGELDEIESSVRGERDALDAATIGNQNSTATPRDGKDVRKKLVFSAARDASQETNRDDADRRTKDSPKSNEKIAGLSPADSPKSNEKIAGLSPSDSPKFNEKIAGLSRSDSPKSNEKIAGLSPSDSPKSNEKIAGLSPSDSPKSNEKIAGLSPSIREATTLDPQPGTSRSYDFPFVENLDFYDATTDAESEEDDEACNVTFTQYIDSEMEKNPQVLTLDRSGKMGAESNEIVSLRPKFNPPSRRRILDTMESYGIPKYRNQEPFFSDDADVPKQKELAQRMLKVPGRSLKDLQPFASSVAGVAGLARWRRMKINELQPNLAKSKDINAIRAIVGDETVNLTPLTKPPTPREVKNWLRAREYLEKKKKQEEVTKGTKEERKIEIQKEIAGREEDESDLSVVEASPEKIGTLRTKFAKRGLMKKADLLKNVGSTALGEKDSPEAGGSGEEPQSTSQNSDSNEMDPSLLSVLQKSRLFKEQEASRRLGVSRGQIDFLSDSTRSNVANENMQNAKALTRYQYLTIMCLEVHVNTRGDLLPDSQHDSISAIFYSVQSDVPPTSSIKPLEHGAIILADEEKARNKMHYSYASSVPWSVAFTQNEEALLNALVTLVTRVDPEILIGWELETLSWGYVFQRASRLGINLSKRISRIPATQCKWETPAPEIESMADVRLPGRIVLDIWRIMRHEAALLSYTFESMMHHVLNERVPCPSFRILTSWWSLDQPRSSRWRVVEHYGLRVLGVFRMLDQLDVIGRTSELARLFGIQFYEVFSRGSQYRVESVMHRLAKPLNYIAVSPSPLQRASMRAMEALPLIMEPESMFYSDPLIVLDFQSLYPSIIIAHNYCFSTCLGRIEHIGQPQPFEFGAYTLRVPKNTALKLQGKVNFAPCGVAFVKPEVRLGILPRMLTEILETRFMVKKAMKDHKQADKTLQRALHSRQLGLKLLANVTYGYTAANFSGRMPCIEVGDSVVSKSKETLERAIKLVESTPKWGARVVYGDTDSLFILVPGKSKADAFVIGNEIADAVTASNPPPIKLKFEKVMYPSILQTKKRYCGYMYETPEQETPTYLAKGIETVRRDGCPAVSKVLEKTLKILFETKDVSLVKKYVTRQLDKVLRGKVSIQDLTFAKEFRGLKGYRAKACVPALELTRRLMRKDPRAVPRNSERVRYVIVAGAPNQALIHCVRTPWELIDDPGLRPNAVYYVTRVIIPPLNRCLNLMGVDVNAWYREMPHRQILHNPVGQPTDKQKLTIFQYFGTIVCVSCGQPSSKGICTECLAYPADTLVVLHEKLRWLHRTYDQVTSICQSCVGQADIADCSSLDCPVLYRRAQAQRELSQSTHLRGIIECGDKLEF